MIRWVFMGRVVAPFGIRGWVKVQPWSAQRDALCRYPRWWIGAEEPMSEVRVGECRLHGALLVARLEGVEDRDRADALRGNLVAVRRSDLPALGEHEFYQVDLVGIAVVNLRGETIGRVSGFFDNGAHPVMRVESAGVEKLLPWVAPVVHRVDPAAGMIEVDWGADW